MNQNKKENNQEIPSAADGDLHLKRHAQFLLERKLKLQKRWEHVSTVLQKQKAQESKEALDLKKSLLEKNLADAERKRCLRLESISKSNGNLVKRAKAIAKSSQQKYIEDRIFLARSIERKRRISYNFRSSFSSIPRSKLLDPASRASLQQLASQEYAACSIQNWYRKLKFNPICKIYKKIGLSREKASTLTFDQLTAHISSTTVIKATGFLIIRAKRISGSTKAFKNPARVLNSIFMFTFFPTETLTVRDGQEEDLATLADKLITDLDHWISCTSSSAIASLAKSFMTSFELYYDAFEAWKCKDTFKIVDELVSYFMELDAVWIKVIRDEGAMVEWAGPIQDQQSSHLNRIKKFGEKAVVRLIKARKEFIQSVLAQDDGIEITAGDDTMTASQLFILKEKQDSVMASASSTASLQHSKSEKENLPSTQEMNEFGSILSNEMIAHEVLLDPNYSLKPPVKTELEERVAAMAKKVFAESVRAELQVEEYSKTVFSLLMDIQSGLLGMVNEEGPIAREIKEVFDPDFLRHQITNKVFDLSKIIAYAGEKMLQLCAPIRDAEIKALVLENDTATLLMTMIDILEMMRLDLANFRLKSIKPQLKKQAVEYERARFEKALNDGHASLFKTESWLVSSYNALQKIADERNPEGIDHPDLKVKFGQVFNHAFLGLLFSTTPIDPSKLSETFSMDQKRLFEMQNEIQACTIVAALTMLSKNIIPELRSEEKALKELAAYLFTLLKSEGTGLKQLAQEIIDAANMVIHKKEKNIAQLSQLTSTPTAQVHKSITQDQESLINSMVEKTLSYKDPFFSVLSRRLERIVKESIEKTPSGQIKPGVLKKNGLELIESEFVPLLARIGILAQHNRDVYGPYYDDILKKYIV